MKNKFWIILLAVLLSGSVLACIPLLSAGPSQRATITSGGAFIATVDLSVDQEFDVNAPGGGVNTITVRGGAIAVTSADCPDHLCIDRGFCTGGAQIVCLPNRLVISFLGEQAVDSVVG